MNKITRITLLAVLFGATCFAQLYTLTQATVTNAINANVTRIVVSSVTSMTVASASAGTAGTALYVTDQQGPGEAMVVTSIDATNLIVGVRRGQMGTKAVAHLALANIYYGNQNLLKASDPQGTCTLASTEVAPRITVGSGNIWNCVNGRWMRNADGAFYVPPTQCAFAPTTLTVTNTYPQIGASNLFTLKGISNAAAGTMTLTCNVMVPTNVTTLRGAVITDITLFLASSATGSGVVPTSVGTATLASITFPAAATTETASTVTPVAIGGTVTTTGAGATGFLTAVTTDGSFYTVKHTFSTAVDLSPDLRILQYTFPILQSAASVSTLFTPGLLIHYAGRE